MQTPRMAPKCLRLKSLQRDPTRTDGPYPGFMNRILQVQSPRLRQHSNGADSLEYCLIAISSRSNPIGAPMCDKKCVVT